MSGSSAEQTVSDSIEALRASITYHLDCTLGVDAPRAEARKLHDALALACRDRLMRIHLPARRRHAHEGEKEVHYLSMEYLPGPQLDSALMALGLEDTADAALSAWDVDAAGVQAHAPEPGLGSGGLGRLAACMLEALASRDQPAVGHGLRYEHGAFHQRIVDGHQQELPDDWLAEGDAWSIPRPDERVLVSFGGRVEADPDGTKHWLPEETVCGTPYDRPMPGLNGAGVSRLRLWSAGAPQPLDLARFSRGHHFKAAEPKQRAERLTQVLYPEDGTNRGKALRLRQQYFLVACAMGDLVRGLRQQLGDWSALPERAAVQINDTHPTLAIPELLRLLVDEEGVAWPRACELVRRTCAYTNHTLMPEALEKWPVDLLERVVPRHLDLIYALNHDFLEQVRGTTSNDANEEARRLSCIEDEPVRQLRAAHLCVLGTHSTNGVSQLHSRLLQTQVLPAFAHHMPERFGAVTNGVTHERWVGKANPPLAKLLDATVGEEWRRQPDALSNLAPWAEDAGFRRTLAAVRGQAKQRLAAFAEARAGRTVPLEGLVDVHAKRIHGYKRQLLAALFIAMRYNRLREDPKADCPPRTFVFAGKAAPGYEYAKCVVRMLHGLADHIAHDPTARERLQVVFLPDYNIRTAEHLVPAADVSEQISVAGTEASGTSCMKLMMNGALPLCTRDGANVDILAQAGEANAFPLGLQAHEVEAARATHDPHAICAADPEIRAAVDLLLSHEICGDERTAGPLRAELFEGGDRFLHLADLPSYAEAQARVEALAARPDDWWRAATAQIAHSGWFAADRMVEDYLRRIWACSAESTAVAA